MGSSRTFHIAADRREDVPVTITLEVERLEGPPAKDSFEAHPTRIAPTAMLRSATLVSSTDPTPLFRVFERAMDPPEYQRFFDFCDDPQNQVPIEQLMEIFGYLLEEATAVPTQSPSA